MVGGAERAEAKDGLRAVYCPRPRPRPPPGAPRPRPPPTTLWMPPNPNPSPACVLETLFLTSNRLNIGAFLSMSGRMSRRILLPRMYTKSSFEILPSRPVRVWEWARAATTSDGDDGAAETAAEAGAADNQREAQSDSADRAAVDSSDRTSSGWRGRDRSPAAVTAAASGWQHSAADRNRSAAAMSVSGFHRRREQRAESSGRERKAEATARQPHRASPSLTASTAARQP